ncbi:MAG TPA: HigA family addiction module antitoxin [Casimicrobiaceae bacterium]|nr:HigA family addiction module antitoxin [Casimicrobiaceae bacterium]
MRSLRHRGRRPTHPGVLLREDVLPALGMTQTELARRLGVSRLSVSELLHERRGLTTEMAARVAKLLRTTPESWLRMQAAVDLWELDRHPERLKTVKPLDKQILEAV